MRAMRICSATLVAAALVGCVSKNQGVALGGAVSTAAGTVLLAADNSGNDTMDGADPTAGAVFLVGGLLVLFTAAAMEEKRVEPKPQIITLADVSRVDTVARAHSWQLTKAAYIAARGGHCEKVRTLAEQVQDLDTDMLFTVLLRDVAVRRCVNPSDYDGGTAPPREPPPDEALPPPTERRPSPAEATPALPPGS